MKNNLQILYNNQNGECSVKFKNRIILRHSKKNPLIILSHNEPNFRSNKRMVAYFKLKNCLSHSFSPMINEKDSSFNENEDICVIQFDDFIKIKVFVENDLLKIIPTLLKTKINEMEINHFTINLPANQDEAIYGCGEQFSFLNLRGKCVPLWTQEPGMAKKKTSVYKHLADLAFWAGGEWWTTYFPQPTFISSNNYFVHVESYAYAEFDFTDKNIHSLRINQIPSKIIIDLQKSAPKILESLTLYLGRQRPLPDWVHEGVWLGIIGGLDENDPFSVNNKLKKAKKFNTKVAAIWAEDWSGIKQFKAQTRLNWNWKYSNERYPNLPDYIKELHKEGIKFLGYNNCFLMEGGEMYEYAEKHGFFVKNKDGITYQLPMFTFEAPTLDLTNPETWNWIKNQIKEHMIGIGLDGWMCDFAEYIPMDAKLYSGVDPHLHHNEYPVLWAKVNAEAVKEMGRHKGENAIVFFSRSGNYGTSKFSPLIWAGDQIMRFWLDSGLAAQITSAISLGFSGIGQTHADIAGEFGIFWLKRTKELYMRGTELAAFTSVMRTHEAKGHAGWAWYSDDETLTHFAKYSRIHAALAPYLKVLIEEYSEKGLPMVRHPFIHYEDDPILHQQKPRILQYQFLLGRDLFVAPVYQKGKTRRKLYLPNDKWIHIWSGNKYDGGWKEIDAPLGKIPVFFKQNSKFASIFKSIKEI